MSARHLDYLHYPVYLTQYSLRYKRQNSSYRNSCRIGYINICITVYVIYYDEYIAKHNR